MLRGGLAFVSCFGLLASAVGARAQVATGAATLGSELPPLTFSNLIVRVDGNDEIAKAGGDCRVILLETMRAEGLNAVGAESLVFDRDDSTNADFILGGTLREATCKRDAAHWECCRSAVDWELLNVATEKVIYRTTARYAECGLDGVTEQTIARRLVVGALRKTVRREKFQAALATRKELGNDAAYESARFQRCKTPPILMNKSPDRALDATAVIGAGMGHGSGFFVTSGGLMLTAAHVVTANKLSVRTRDGSNYDAVPLRMSRKFDVALLRVAVPQIRRWLV